MRQNCNWSGEKSVWESQVKAITLKSSDLSDTSELDMIRGKIVEKGKS